MRPPTLDDLVARIADGEPVDWSQVVQLAPDAEARALIDELRAIERLHDSHRSMREEAGPWLPAPPLPPAPVLDDAGNATQPWGKYRLLAKLGAGSFGTVFRGRDDDLHRDLAIKLLHDRGDGRHRPRLLREAQDLARIRHANVVSIYAVEEHAGQVGLCMELIEGRTLDAVLRQDGPLNAEEATAVGQSVGRGLAAIHQAGLLHRDVNAKNVMRERAGRYVLMDLGAGLDTSDATRVAAAGMAGTPLYMAPEVLAGGAATVRSDIYSLGVLLYFLVSGRHPVEGRSREDITRAHGEGKRTFLTERRADLPEAFVRCVERALSREPLNRHGSAAELLAELGPATGTVGPATRSMARVATVAVSSVAVALGVLIVVGAWSSAAVNAALNRPAEFAPEGVSDWLRWGRMAALPFTVYFLFGLVVSQVARLLGRICLSAVCRVVSLEPTRLALPLVAWGLGALSVSSIFFLNWYFPDVVDAFTTPLDAVPAGALDVASPARTSRKVVFGQVLAITAAVIATAWYATLKAAGGRREALPWGAIATGAASLVGLLFIWASAYQVLWFTDSFPRAIYGDEACYVIGQTQEQLLLHCPRLAIKEKTLTVAKASPRLRVLESRGSPYSGL